MRLRVSDGIDTNSVTMGIGIREQSSLKHFVWREADPSIRLLGANVLCSTWAK
jgi:hypothetical protein